MKSGTNHLSTKKIIGLFLKVIGIYGLFLIIGFLWLKNPYSNWYQWWGNKMETPASWFGLVVQFEDNQKKDKEKNDIRGVVMDKAVIEHYKKQAEAGLITEADVPAGDFRFDSFRQGYFPTALLLTLILAYPFGFWKPRIKAVVWGLLLIHLFFWFKSSIWIAYICTQVVELQHLGVESVFWKKVVAYNFRAFVEDMPLRIIVPILIWFVVSFKGEDWKRIIRSKSL